MLFEKKLRVRILKDNLARLETYSVRESEATSNIKIREKSDPVYGIPSDEGDWIDAEIGVKWGGKQQWTAFRGEIDVPREWKKDAIRLAMRIGINYLEQPADDNFPAGPEGQVFINGERAGAIDNQHKTIKYTFTPGKKYDIKAIFFAARCACRHTLDMFAIEQIDAAADELYHDLRVALDIVEHLDENSIAREKLLCAVEAAFEKIDFRLHSLVDATTDDGKKLVYDSINAAKQAFDSIVGNLPSGGSEHKVVGVGHAHIDLGWLWPISQSHHKCVRSFATQCRLLEQYPNWVFMQSSPQAYEWLESDAPDLFTKIKKHIDGNRWEAEGATWCEMDTNLPSGESLVRQLLYGKHYFKNKLGIDSRLLWLPDVFGYSAALPQLLKLAGVTGFVTSKLSWSQYNRFPHDTFNWKGIDGSEIPTHFITTPVKPGYGHLTYNAKLTVTELVETVKEYKQNHLEISPVMSFGFGDGGGGVTELMLETGKRVGSGSAMDRTGLPVLKYEKAGDLMERIAKKTDILPTWDGELYLEYHRGTYTTQAWLKRANRKIETKLHNAEWLGSLASEYGYEFDKAKIDVMWKELLLMQFHDILPGSSVGELYEEIRPRVAAIAAGTDEITEKAANLLTEKIDTSDAKNAIVLFNTLSWDRSDPIHMPDDTWRDDIVIPSGGWVVVNGSEAVVSEKPTLLSVSDDGKHLTNRYWSIQLNDKGEIAQLYDRINNRHVLKTDSVGNQWQVFVDRPCEYDAWDIDDDYRNHPLPGPIFESIRIAEQSPVRIAIEIVWHMPKLPNAKTSTITQRIAIYANHPRIDFETIIDWHLHHQLLKVAFDVDIRATQATYEIQFGHIQRPTHRNTSWDVARFECCGHKFVDLTEHNYGISLLNDCKYGHDILNQTIRLTCIKSPQAPDAKADQGLHEFTYSLLPHRGDFQNASVIHAAAELNNPVIAVPVESTKGDLPQQFSFVTCDNDAIIIDTVKPAENKKETILRLYESHGSHAQGTLTLHKKIANIEIVNLLEEQYDGNIELTHEPDSNNIKLQLKPFEVITLKLI